MSTPPIYTRLELWLANGTLGSTCILAYNAYMLVAAAVPT